MPFSDYVERIFPFAEHCEWPGFDTGLLYRNEDSIWDRNSAYQQLQPAQTGGSWLSGVYGTTPAMGGGPGLVSPPNSTGYLGGLAGDGRSAGLWMPPNWGGSTSIDGSDLGSNLGNLWGNGGDARGAEDFGGGPAAIFDPFNSLDTSRIWHPSASPPAAPEEGTGLESGGGGSDSPGESAGSPGLGRWMSPTPPSPTDQAEDDGKAKSDTSEENSSGSSN